MRKCVCGGGRASVTGVEAGGGGDVTSELAHLAAG